MKLQRTIAGILFLGVLYWIVNDAYGFLTVQGIFAYLLAVVLAWHAK